MNTVHNNSLLRGVVIKENNEYRDLGDFFPSGSGFDTDWHVEENDNEYKFSSAYHAMDENGFYSGWLNFDITVDKNTDFQTWYYNFDIEYNDADLDTESVWVDGLIEYIDYVICETLMTIKEIVVGEEDA